MSVVLVPSNDEILQAFRLIDGLTDDGTSRGPMLAFRERLVGELVGDADRVAATLDVQFELLTFANGTRSVVSREAMIAGIRHQAERAGSSVMWMELDDLVVSSTAIAGQGRLRTLSAGGGEPVAEARLTSMPLAFFVRFDGVLMVGEVIYMDAGSAETTVVAGDRFPSMEQLRTLTDHRSGQ